MQACLVLVVVALSTSVHGLPKERWVDGAIKESEDGHLRKRRDTDMKTMETMRSGCPYASMDGRALHVQAIADRVRRGVDTKKDKKDKNKPKKSCAPSIKKCDPQARYRNPDGSCNNLDNAEWGMMRTPQPRLVDAAYDDKKGSPRSKGVDGNQLENARVISNAVHAGPSTTPKSNKHTLHMMQWGQFLDHDIILTPLADAEDCCESSESQDIDVCFPLFVEEEDDPVFDVGHCMDFPRSAEATCTKNVRQQINGITSFVDGSNIYGSHQEELDILANTGTGFMNTAGDDRLPNQNDSTCNVGICPVAGDVRAAEQPALTTYHTMWVLEHNRIVKELKEHFSADDNLFESVRLMVMAILQKITYDEFLPALLSETAMEKYGLASSETYVYDDTVDPGVLNEFGIAYRLGHSMIPDNIPARVENTEQLSQTPIEDTFFDTTLTNEPGLDALAYGLSAAPAGALDELVSDGVRSNLFGNLDLAALNIQRGRDHGLPGYDAYRKWCGLSPVESWEDMPVHDDGVRDKLMSVYESPNDIDLWTAVVTERPVTGGTIGPVGECIVGEQFRRLKYGDRFWYQGSVYDLNQAQLDSFKEYTLAKVLCNNFEFEKINYPNAFLASDPLTKCSDIPDLDFPEFYPPSGGNS